MLGLCNPPQLAGLAAGGHRPPALTTQAAAATQNIQEAAVVGRQLLQRGGGVIRFTNHSIVDTKHRWWKVIFQTDFLDGSKEIKINFDLFFAVWSFSNEILQLSEEKSSPEGLIDAV